MLAKVHTIALVGVQGLPVEVEVDIALGLPSFATVGLAEGAVKESKDRVKAAIKNSGYSFPNRRITVNLAPADIKKGGTSYDLPIAMGILAASEILTNDLFAETAMLGELSLDGCLRPVQGVLPMVIGARNSGSRKIIVPEENSQEAALVDGIDVYPLSSLDQAVEFMTQPDQRSPQPRTEQQATTKHDDLDFADVKGQDHVKRAVEIAATGNHNLLLSGPPGSGKTMIARRIPSILPPLTREEALQTTMIYSISGLLDADQGLVNQRPFRSPHHTISDAGLIGGGNHPRPGEVSLAHNGLLFLDELPEFKKHVLEVLRQPMEDGEVTIARAASTLCFPARFMLIAAMNPCSCGFFGDSSNSCSCTALQISRYKTKLSGPLLDRIDMQLEVSAVPFEHLHQDSQTESSAQIRQRVLAARKIQAQRFSRDVHIHANSQMGSRELKKFCQLSKQSLSLLETSMTRLKLSARAYSRILKIARTIADLADSADIKTSHLAEAIGYRRLDQQQTP